MSSSLVVDSENAYWVNLVYGVMRVPITGGTPSVVPGAENGARAVGRVALDSTYVYWTSEMSPGGEVRRAPKAGGAATTIFTVTQRPKYIAVHGGAVTWSTWDNLSGAYTITTGAITGGMQKVLAFGGGVMGLDNISGLVADDMYAYWSDTIKIGHVASVYLSGGVPPAVWGLNARGTSIAIDSTNMYWLETDSGAVKSCPKTGCVGQPTTLASGTFTNAVPELATDGAFVYWTDGAKDGTVTRVRVIGGTPEVLATGQKQPTTIAVDDKAVYWVSALQEVAWGSVMRLAKP